MSFPKFPNFHKLLPADRDAYNDYYRTLQEPSADVSFDNALVWLDFHNDLEVCELNNNLVIRFTDILNNNTSTYSLIGIHELEDTLTTLFDYLKIYSTAPTLSYLSEQAAEAIRALKKPTYIVEEDPDNNNYVSNADDLAAMQGRAFKNQRRRVNNFMEANPNIQVEEFDLSNTGDRRIMHNSILRWTKTGMHLRNDPANWELPALKRYFKLVPFMNAKAYGVYIDGILVSITLLNFPPHKNWLIASHLKYNYEYKGLYGYTIYVIAVIAKTLGIKWINYEQDLGKEGLRQAKLFLNPEKFIRQYTVSLDSGTSAQ